MKCDGQIKVDYGGNGSSVRRWRVICPNDHFINQTVMAMTVTIYILSKYLAAGQWRENGFIPFLMISAKVKQKLLQFGFWALILYSMSSFTRVYHLWNPAQRNINLFFSKRIFLLKFVSITWILIYFNISMC